MQRLRQVLFLFLPFLLFFYACQSTSNPFKQRIRLSQWQFCPSDSATNQPDNHWLPVRLPATIFAALRQNGRFKDVFVGENLRHVDVKPFQKSWFYQTRFSLPKLNEFPRTILRFKGINYRANIWLNGQKIADQDTIFGAFRIFKFDASNVVKEKNNILRVQVFPPQAGDFTIGFVDWNPPPPDRNMGLWRPVEILRSRAVHLENPFVKSVLDSSYKQAKLAMQVTVQNLAEHEVSGTLVGRIGEIKFAKPIRLDAKSTRLINLDYHEFPQLILKNPKLWWPHPFGKPALYHLQMEFKVNGRVSDRLKTDFGIRKIESYFTDKGYRGFKINGRKILIRGGGWTDDLFLADTPQKVRAQLRYVKQMGLNTIRLEGFWGNDQTLYRLCDSLGILVMAGFSCHWEWESYLGKACDRFGGASTAQDFDLLSSYWHDQITWLRNHPSIFVWLGGSDMLPRPELEKRYLQILARIDGTRPYLGSAAANESKVSGPTGVKMNGPYDYVPPKYWFEDRKHGGAYGFNTETGPGPQPPPLSSLKRMIPADHLWPIDSVWEYHCGRNEFNSLKRYRKALNERYGKPGDLDDFVKKAQAMNYEAMRPMFEAFAVNKFNATGVIQWMLNSAWPELYWQLYDYYLMPNGAFYGAKKACAPLQLMYNYKNHWVYLNNSTLTPAESLWVHLRMYDLQSNLVDEREKMTDIGENTVKPVLKAEMKYVNTPVYFLDLRLSDRSGKRLADNFYWLSKKADVLNYSESTWYVTPQSRFADFRALNRMPKANVLVKSTMAPGGNRIAVHLKNTSSRIAFLIYLELQDENGQPILPVFWEDNYISLLPKEERLVEVQFNAFARPKVVVQGWNTVVQNEAAQTDSGDNR